ncbi:PEP-CTERM sorting domain-containing protein [Desulfospira joergensenii]|uniref:PEP-CTERM sorting domain-containing protein n=1 Tax=Desulfospira joergensenii TaxID=53329 RepID=UPI0003B3DBF1|nr:PEP-CTERM sorting domain-containing protein [Desulfospira joergensenii]
MKKLIFTYGLIFLLFGYIGVGWASYYSEADSGDLNGHPFDSVGTFDIGTNTVTGSIYLDPSPSSDYDNFNFKLLSGYTITSATITVTGQYWDNNPGNGIGAKARWYSPYSGIEGNWIDLLNPSPQNLFLTDTTTLSGGFYRLYQAATHYPGDGWTADYVIEFNVADANAPVPEPATMFLFGIGLLGLAGVSRKTSAALK